MHEAAFFTIVLDQRRFVCEFDIPFLPIERREEQLVSQRKQRSDAAEKLASVLSTVGAWNSKYRVAMSQRLDPSTSIGSISECCKVFEDKTTVLEGILKDSDEVIFRMFSTYCF